LIILSKEIQLEMKSLNSYQSLKESQIKIIKSEIKEALIIYSNHSFLVVIDLVIP